MALDSRYPEAIHGDGLVLRPWNWELLQQLAAWGERGFPYHAFDLGHLRDPERALQELEERQREGHHLHFIACEGGVAVGRVSVNLKDPAGLYLWGVHVAPEHEGRGVCRRMLAALIGWLEEEYPGKQVVLTTNTFAEHAHRAYRAVGFEVLETRWHYDADIAAKLWRVSPEEREPLAEHIRFHNGRWEVRTYLMGRSQGARMSSSLSSTGADATAASGGC